MTVRYVPDCGVPEMMSWLRGKHDWLCLDLETTGLNPWKDTIRLVSIGDSDRAYAFPWDKDLTQMVIDRAPMTITNQNVKFDKQFLHVAGVDESKMIDDTKAMLHFIDSRVMSLKPAADMYLGDNSSDAQSDMKSIMKKNKWTWETIPVDTFEYWWYGGMDTILTSKLAAMHFPRIQSEYAELYDMEIDVMLAFAQAERRGMRLDAPYCEQQAETLRAHQREVQAPYPFDLGGKKELTEALADRGIRAGRTAKGNPSITSDVLEPYRGDMLVDDVLEFRRLDKLAGTYFEPWLNVVYKDGRVHPTVNTIGARTGRMSSDNPNMQNVPKRKAGDALRRAFLPTEGHVFVAADYAQIEYRLFASAANEPAMIQAFLDGQDMHRVTAEMALGREVTDAERDLGKNGNFAEIYMAGIPKFARTAGITIPQATDFRRRYHEAFPRVKPFTHAVMEYARSNGFCVRTRFGRDIPVDHETLYAAINYLIQGTAADILKRAILRLQATDWVTFLSLAVHDELIFDVPEEVAPDLVRDLPEIMEDRETFKVPITVETKTMRRWGSASSE